MSGDLISRSALLEELQKGTIITDDLYGMGIMAGNDHAMKKIKEAPAVEAVPVRHGRWESNSVLVGYMKWEYFYECTACGRRGTNHKTHYCPNCGAKMDKEAEN